jgi:hypothetical protein
MGKDVKPSDSPDVIRWTISRKKEVVLRLMRGEPIDALSRELGVEVYRLEKWHRKALQGIEPALKAREGEILWQRNLMPPCAVLARSPWKTSCSGTK